MKVSFLLSLALVLASSLAVAQTDDSDDIQVSASFSSSIDLTVTAGSQISFNVVTLDDYTNGLADATAYNSTFEVNSSVDFQVDFTATDFSDGAGNTINANNFGYVISDAGSHAAGTNHLLLGASTTPSAYALLGDDNTIVEATGSGNAGPGTANRFTLKFELGTSSVRALSGLPTLLEQNIAPATYTSTVTLTASAMP
ncbi:MAG: hypothetical protein OHK0039_34960 [Bacteroidia bacterium]